MPTTTQLLEYDGVSQRVDTFRFDVLDQNLAVQGTISPSEHQVPQVVNDTTRTTCRTLQTLHLTAGEAVDVDVVRNRIRPVAILEDLTEFPIGVFLYDQTPRTRHSYGLELDATLFDQTSIIDTPIGSSVAYDAGASVFSAIQEQCSIAGFPSVQITPTTAIVGTPMSWGIGTSRYKVIADLCAVAGFLPPYFNNLGLLICRPAPDLSQITALLKYNAGALASGRIIADSMVETDNRAKVPNRYIVTGGAVGATPIVGVFDIPDSDLASLKNRGYLVVNPPVAMQGLADSDAANKAAQALYVSDPNRYFKAEFDAKPDFRHDTWDPLEYLGDVGLEIGWTLPCIPGSRMHHAWKRAFV